MTLFIQQIEIDNFKSFSGVTVIPFQTGFTTISGPNGSGKSNIIDSVLFCLGLSTSRTLRAEKLTDLINHSTRRREARVNITFGDFEKPDEPKFVVGRSIKDNRSSGYVSTYYLNNKPTTLTEIQDTLSRHNISAQAYNVLMQGDVTGIINMSALERRRIIDEVAGVSEFDRKIEQADKEMATVGESVERLGILREELNLRQQQLAEERAQALKYQKLKQEKQELESQILLATYRDLHHRIQALKQSRNESEKEKETQQRQLKTMQDTISQIEVELQEISLEVKRKGEDQQIALKKQIESLRGAVGRKQDTISFNQQKMGENTESIKKCLDEMQRLKGEQTDFDTAIAEAETKKQAAQLVVDKSQKAFEQTFEQFNQLSEQNRDATQAQIEAKRQLSQLQDQLAQKQRDHLVAQGNLERLSQASTEQEQTIVAKKARLEEINKIINTLNPKVTDSELEKQGLQAQIERTQLEVSQSRVAFSEAQNRLQQIEREIHKLEAQKRAYDEVGFGRAIDTVLQSGINGVHGTIAQLMTADSDVMLALEIALGGRIKALVVDNDKVAQQGVELLKQTQSGRATFLPLNKIKAFDRLPLLPSDDAIVGFAQHLAQFDSQFETVFSYAFGDTVVVEDINSARKYIGKFRMVTLDGALFEKTGAITGGSAQRQTSGLSQSARLAEEIKALEASFKPLQTEKENQQKKLAQAEIKLDELKQKYMGWGSSEQEEKIQLNTLSREQQEITDFLTRAEKQWEIDLSTEKEVASLLKEISADMQTLEKNVAEQTQTLEKLEANLPTDVLEELKAKQSSIEAELREHEKLLRDAESALHAITLEKEFMEKGLESYETQIETLKNNNQKLEAEAKEALEEIALIEEQIKGLIEQEKQMDQELVQLQEKRDAVQAKLIEQEREKYALIQKITTLEEQITSFAERIQSLQPELKELKQQIIDNGQDPEAALDIEMKDIEEIQKAIQSIQRRMDALGDVNMRAIADYDEVNSRLEELAEKLDTLSRERTDLMARMSSYEELKLKSFTDAFEAVNTHFKDIFAELSDGEGQLILTNPQSPFQGGLTIEAKPRGKKTLRLEAMSGGEKSLTALAFVFSFQRYMPAPFYAFDEVDMFLDGINAEKLASMVKKQSQQAQFIVVSLRKPMLSRSDLTVGVTQRKDGVTKVIGADLKEDLKDAS